MWQEPGTVPEGAKSGPLSEREQRLLDQIERALQAENPKLASALRGRYRHESSRLRFVEGVTVFAIGLVLLVVGVGITSLSATSGLLWLSAVGFLLMFGGAVLAVASIGPIRKASRPRPANRIDTGAATAGTGASGGGSSRSDSEPR
jgi:hypothetical protein